MQNVQMVFGFWGQKINVDQISVLSHPKAGLSLLSNSCLLFFPLSLSHFSRLFLSLYLLHSHTHTNMWNYKKPTHHIESSLSFTHAFTGLSKNFIFQVNKIYRWHLAIPIFKNRSSPFDMKDMAWVLCVLFV